MTLEDIREIFNHGFGIKYASELQKQQKVISRERRASVVSAGMEGV